jgi:pyruvate/2-oxoglutarate dehydrogenase complex dihydrolipoamide acyltransferase (E2) component
LLRPPHFVPQTNASRELLAEMQVGRFNLATVVDDYGAIGGLVTFDRVVVPVDFGPRQDRAFAGRYGARRPSAARRAQTADYAIAGGNASRQAERWMLGQLRRHGPTVAPAQGACMDFSSQFDQLNQRVTEAKAAAQAAADSREELRQRIDRAQADLDKAASDARQRASEATSDSRGKWAQMKADAAARRDDVKAKIDKRTRQTDAKAAASDADWAEADAVDALDYAAWTVDNAELAVLDAIDARAYADDRAKLASPR